MTRFRQGYGAASARAATLRRDLREMVREQYDYRDLLYQMTRRDLLLRYKQTVMGFGWAVFMPLVNTAVFSVIFTRVAPLNVDMPYPLFAYCGLLAWNFSASSFRFSVVSLTSNANLVTKVYFPREIFPLSAVLVSLVDLAVGSTVLVALMVYYQVAPTTALLALPWVLMVHVMFTMSVSLLLAMANLFYRDVKYLFELVLTVWMFVSAVLYPVSQVGGVLGRIMAFNPVTPILEGYRDVILRGQLPDPAAFGITTIVSAIFLAGAWLTFHRAEYAFAENV
ncbi:MAG TPA: ABC transporter permease [Vicinamibacterales bacterium]|nr:ABC transporter permease [Vicinamibacterales bacterium]